MTYDRALQKDFPTERSRKEYLKQHGLAHDGSMESDKKRTSRLAEIINEDRNKQGLKSKTVQELVGNSRKIPGRTFYSFGK